MKNLALIGKNVMCAKKTQKKFSAAHPIRLQMNKLGQTVKHWPKELSNTTRYDVSLTGNFLQWSARCLAYGGPTKAQFHQGQYLGNGIENWGHFTPITTKRNFTKKLHLRRKVYVEKKYWFNKFRRRRKWGTEGTQAKNTCCTQQYEKGVMELNHSQVTYVLPGVFWHYFF